MSVTCRSCWAEWKDMEFKIINEYRLNMLEREHRPHVTLP
jgi:Fe-S cluster biosynthesis and repair protein YggX